MTNATTGTNATYAHHGSVSIWNTPTWRYYHINATGSPQAQRIQILRGMEVERKKRLAEKLAGIDIIATDAETAEE